MRPLTLHASALSDVEYEIYTSSLNDIADEPRHSSTVHDDAHYEQMTIGLREARAWLRGRYSHIPPSTMDAILKFFSPSFGANDSLSGGQFFAALRLAVHADNGKQVDRSLAFVQAYPLSTGSQVNSSLPPPPSKSASLSLPPLATQVSPAPSTSTHTAANNPFTILTNLDDSTHNSQAPPQHPMLRVDSLKSTSHSSHNPFTQKPNDPFTNKTPPLPPRKPPPPVPPSLRHAAPPVSVKRSTSPIHQGAGAMPLAGAAPAPPPPKPVSHVTSTLIKQSLHATKVAQSLKKAEEQLEKERIMQVLKSSSGTVRNRSSSPDKAYGHITAASSSSRSDSDDRAAPPLPKRRNEHVQNSVLGRPLNPSPPQSTSSFDQIALAGLSPRHEASTSLASSVKSDAHSLPPGPIERGRSRSHPPSTSERARSEHSYATQTVANLDSHSRSVVASTTSSPARLTTVLPPVPPPTHPDRRERDERDRDKRYGSPSVHSSKSGKSNQTSHSGGRTTTLLLRPSQAPTSSQTQGQALSAHVDTRPFDSVYGALVSPISTGDNREGCATAAHSAYATPPESVQLPPSLPPLITALPNGMPGLLTPVSPDSPTPTTTKPSPTARVFRSKSMHQSSTPPPVPPPLRRKRPESVQVLSASDSVPASADSGGTMFQELVNRFEGSAVGVDEGDGSGQGTKMLSRHLSLSSPGLGTITKGGMYGGGRKAGLGSSHSPVPNSPRGSSVLRRSSLSHAAATSAPASGTTHHSHGHHHSIHGNNYNNGTVDEHLSLAGLQRTFASLQPKLDKARYKAEAGISRRGFIQGDGEGPDSGGESGGEREGLVRHHSRRRVDESLAMNGRGRATPEEHEWIATSNSREVERDDCQWPVDRIAEGWAPL